MKRIFVVMASLAALVLSGGAMIKIH